MTSGQDTWSARCGESRTPGAASGSGKRSGRKADTAPRPDSTGKFYRSAMYLVLSRINAYLMRWIRKKYKRLRAKGKAYRCWRKIVEQRPRMFAHWKWVPSVLDVW